MSFYYFFLPGDSIKRRSRDKTLLQGGLKIKSARLVQQVQLEFTKSIRNMQPNKQKKVMSDEDNAETKHI
jgi:hypothetical protein